MTLETLILGAAEQRERAAEERRRKQKIMDEFSERARSEALASLPAELSDIWYEIEPYVTVEDDSNRLALTLHIDGDALELEPFKIYLAYNWRVDDLIYGRKTSGGTWSRSIKLVSPSAINTHYGIEQLGYILAIQRRRYSDWKAKQLIEQEYSAARETFENAYREWRKNFDAAMAHNQALVNKLNDRLQEHERKTVWKLHYATVYIGDDGQVGTRTEWAYILEYNPDANGFWRKLDRGGFIRREKYFMPVRIEGPFEITPMYQEEYYKSITRYSIPIYYLTTDVLQLLENTPFVQWPEAPEPDPILQQDVHQIIYRIDMEVNNANE